MQTNPSIIDNDSETVSPTWNNRLESMRKLILFNNIRLMLIEQLCFLDIKEESHSYFTSELSKFFQHRALLELEHSRGLENIFNFFQFRHSETTSKSSKLFPSHTAYSCWNLLIAETQLLSFDYNTLSEIYTVDVILKLEKVLQTYKKYYELVAETHEEILRILRNFYTTITTYTIYQKNDKCSSDNLETLKARNIYKHFTETSNVDMHKNMLRDLKDIIHSIYLGFCLMVSKAILAHVNSEQKDFQKKLNFLNEENILFRSDKSVDYKNDKCSSDNLETLKARNIYKHFTETSNVDMHKNMLRDLKDIIHKNDKCSSDNLETLKARNIYKHFTETSNVDMHKNMLRDLKDIIHSMDLGFCLMVSKAILAHVNSEQKDFQKKLNFLNEKNILFRSDKAVDYVIGKSKFLEKNWEIVLIEKDKFNKEKNDEAAVSIESLIHSEFELQSQSLKLKEEKLRTNLEVIYGILDTLELNTASLLGHESKIVNDINPQLEVKSKIAQAKSLSNSSQSAVIKQISLKSHLNSSVLESKAKKIPNYCQIRPRLFGGSLEDYLKITNEQIPLIMRSCIRVISTYGLRSQGIFRVSGSQIEIINFRESFEHGEDPLAGASDTSDMNSVAGVLKLYLRELQEPLFPSKYFDFFLSLTQKESEQDVVVEMKNFFKTISKPVAIVIRFLFSFLNHLSEFASENMMDAFNLAISFGPTLMPTPEDRKQVQYQTQLNELIKIIIEHHQDVFPKDLGGPRYQK